MVGSGRAEAMAAGRRAESDRRRQRVPAAIKAAGAEGEAVTVSGVARRAGVDRTFFYRHRDLLDQVHALAARPSGLSAEGAVPITFQGDPGLPGLVAEPGMTFLPCPSMIRGVLSPGAEGSGDC